MGWIELAEEDRKKFDTPERIELNYGRWGLKSIDALETEVGWTLEDLGNELQRKKVVDGAVVMQDELDEDGNPILNADGSTKQTAVSAPSKTAFAAVVWMALRDIGIRIPWDDFNPQAAGLRIDWSGGPGKAEGSEDPPG